MDAPESLDKFAEQLKVHFTSYPVFTTRLVKVDTEFYLKQVTDEAVLADQFKIVEERMDLKEAEKFMAQVMSETISSEDTRLKMFIIRQKKDPSKVFVFSKVDHIAVDGIGLLQTFANMQDDSSANSVPCPNRQSFSLEEKMDKTAEYTSMLEKSKNRYDAFKQVEVATTPFTRQFDLFISEDISLPKLKTRAREAGLTINDLFSGACITAFSKLNLPEEKRPSQFTCKMANWTPE